jgi:hypothetical protein
VVVTRSENYHLILGLDINYVFDRLPVTRLHLVQLLLGRVRRGLGLKKQFL